MTIALKRFLSVSAGADVSASKGELIVAPPEPPTLDELAAGINADYAELQDAALTAVERAISIGKGLNEAKTQLTHGRFSGYITSNFRFTMRWAQQCMRLAKNEAEVLQRLEELRSISSHLSLAEAFKLIGSLNPKPKRRRKRPRAT